MAEQLGPELKYRTDRKLDLFSVVLSWIICSIILTRREDN